jgi:hypothetical protein
VDFTTLTGAKTAAGSIRRWINYDEADSDHIIAQSENWLAQKLRVRRMVAKATDLTLASGASTIDLSTELPYFLDAIRLHIQGYGKVTFVHEDDMDMLRGEDTDGDISTGVPSYWTVVGETIYFDTEADQEYTIYLTYYKKPTPLSADNTTNIYTQHYSALFQMVCMGWAYVEALKDDARATSMFTSAEAHIATLLGTDDLSRRAQEYDHSAS